MKKKLRNKIASLLALMSIGSAKSLAKDNLLVNQKTESIELNQTKKSNKYVKNLAIGTSSVLGLGTTAFIGYRHFRNKNLNNKKETYDDKKTESIESDSKQYQNNEEISDEKLKSIMDVFFKKNKNKIIPGEKQWKSHKQYYKMSKKYINNCIEITAKHCNDENNQIKLIYNKDYKIKDRNTINLNIGKGTQNNNVVYNFNGNSYTQSGSNNLLNFYNCGNSITIIGNTQLNNYNNYSILDLGRNSHVKFKGNNKIEINHDNNSILLNLNNHNQDRIKLNYNNDSILLICQEKGETNVWCI